MASSTAGKQDTRTSLRDSHPDSWIPTEKGDALSGKILAVDDAWSDVRNDGSFYPLLTVEVDEATGYPAPPEGPTELKVHAFGAVLFNEVMKHRPEVGERVTFTYLGESEREPARGRNRPKLYRLQVHDRPDTAGRAYDRISKAQRSEKDAGEESDIPWEA